MKWEYQTIRLDRKTGFFTSSLSTEWIDLRLKASGLLGWELVSFSVTSWFGNEISALAILKRPIKESV